MQRVVRIIHKDSSTWVKKSRKHFDWGWADYIPDYMQDTFSLDSYEKRGLPPGYSFTKSGANKLALQDAKKRFQEMKRDSETKKLYPNYLKLYENMISKLKGLYTKSKKK